MRRTIVLSAVLGWVALAAPAEAQNPIDALTAERVVALARARAPLIRRAEGQVLAARGRLAGARALGQDNPSIEGVANRYERFERRTEWELNVPLGFGLARAARVGVARAELDRDQQLVADARRGAVGAALAEYYRVLHATGRVGLAIERDSVAAQVRRTAEDRHRAGEVPRLEVLLSETEEVRAHSERLAEEQSLVRAKVALAANLGLPSGESLAIAGDLADQSLLAQLLAAPAPPQRADVIAAERELTASRAEKRLARTVLLPGFAFRLHYGHEDGESIVQPGLAVTVPLFQYGQESRQLARAREAQASVELERARSAAAAEAEGFARAFDAATEAAQQLADQALPRVDESENMVRESYRAGKIDLLSLLVVRRDLLETRREYLDRLLEAALAGIDLAVARGQFQ